MNGFDDARFLYLLALLVFVASALFAHRIPIRQGLRMALAWVAIFGVVFVLFALKDDLLPALRGDATAIVAGETTRIRAAEDGHFWVDAEVNGETVRFLVDSGASTTTISAETARRAGIAPSGGFPVVVDTANGIIEVQRGRAERLRLGTIERADVPLHISDRGGETNLLGMSFLSTLSRWGVEGRELVLEP